uniref:Uncharacterized protein n=1 Tax=Parastrongyloides trichosuri TaxID=131310 RepID=A0A0N4ZZP4_PARTI
MSNPTDSKNHKGDNFHHKGDNFQAILNLISQNNDKMLTIMTQQSEMLSTIKSLQNEMLSTIKSLQNRLNNLELNIPNIPATTPRCSRVKSRKQNSFGEPVVTLYDSNGEEDTGSNSAEITPKQPIMTNNIKLASFDGKSNFQIWI